MDTNYSHMQGDEQDVSKHETYQHGLNKLNATFGVLNSIKDGPARQMDIQGRISESISNSVPRRKED